MSFEEGFDNVAVPFRNLLVGLMLSVYDYILEAGLDSAEKTFLWCIEKYAAQGMIELFPCVKQRRDELAKETITNA